MSNEYVTVKNLVTRKVGQVRRRIAEHAIFGAHLEIVPDGTKSVVSIDELVQKRKPQKPVPHEVSDEELEILTAPDEKKED